MSLVGDAIARATAAGTRAAQIAPFVHCEIPLRDRIRWRLALDETDRTNARAFWRELEDRWRLVDAGLPAWKDI